MATVRSLQMAFGGDLKKVFAEVKQNLFLDVADINEMTTMSLWHHDKSGKIVITGLANPDIDKQGYIPGTMEARVKLETPVSIQAGKDEELVNWLEERYRGIINVSNGQQDCLYVCLWLPLWDKELVADALKMVTLMEQLRETSTYCVDIIGLAADMLPVVSDDKNKVGADKKKANEQTVAEMLKTIVGKRKECDILRNVIVLQNKTVKGISLDLTSERLAGLVEEIVVIYAEENQTVFYSPYRTEVRGLGISILNFDRYYFADRMLTRAYLYIMDKEGVNDDDADVARLSQTVNGKLVDQFGKETKLLSHFWENHIKEQLARGRSAEDVSKNVYEDIHSYLNEISDEVLKFLQDSEFTLPEKRAGLASLFGEDDELFKGMVYNTELPILDDCEIEPAQVFVDYHNEMVTEINELEEDEDEEKPLDKGAMIAELPLNEYADEDGMVRLPIEEMRRLKRRITNSTDSIRRLTEEMEKAQAEIETSELVNKVEVKDGTFVVKGHSYRYLPEPMDEKALDKFYEPSVRSLPAAYSLKDGMSPVRNQGQIGSCTAHAAIGAFEFLARQSGQDLDLNELFNYYKARELDGFQNEDRGATLYSAVMSLSQAGVCRESDWTAPDQFTAPSAEAEAAAKQFMVVEALSVKHDMQHFKDAIASGYPVLMALNIYPSFANAAATKGFVVMPSQEELAGEHGGHAMLICGYSDKEGVFIVRNSWGEDFGDGGYCYVPYSYMESTDLFCQNSSFVIRKISLESDKQVDTRPMKTTVNFNVDDAAIRYAIASVKLDEEQKRLAKLNEEYIEVLKRYRTMMSDIRDNEMKQTLEGGVRKKREKDVQKLREATAKKQEELERWKIEFDFVTIKKLSGIALPVIAFIALTLITKMSDVAKFSIEGLLKTVCYLGMGVSVVAIGRLLLLTSMKTKQSEEDQTTFGVVLPKAAMAVWVALFVIFFAALVTIGMFIGDDPYLKETAIRDEGFRDVIRIVFGIIWKLAAVFAALMVIIGVVVWLQRRDKRRREMEDLENDFEAALRKQTAAEDALKTLHLRTFVAGTLHNEFSLLKDNLRSVYNKMISYTNNLEEWYKAETAHLAEISAPDKVPFINVIDEKVVDEYFDENRDTLTNGIKLSSFIEQYKVDEREITEFKYKLKQMIVEKIFALCNDFNMSDYLMGKVKYGYLPEMTPEKCQEYVDEMSHRSQVFLQIRNSASINITEMRYFMINTSGLSTQSSWHELMASRFLDNLPSIIGTELRHCGAMVNVLETDFDSLVITKV